MTIEQKTGSQISPELVSQGWRFLGNFDNPGIGDSISDGEIRFGPLLPAEAFRGEFIRRGFSDVKVSAAYDAEGKYLPGYRAIYVKGEADTQKVFRGTPYARE